MLVVEVLDGKKHDRKAFNCDSPELNDYLKTKASQDVRDGYCQVYVVTNKIPANPPSPKHYIYGFFSLSSHMIERHDIDPILSTNKGYKTIPAILLGRLAKDNSQELLTGSELLLLALNKSSEAKEKFGGVFIITHPKNERAKSF